MDKAGSAVNGNAGSAGNAVNAGNARHCLRLVGRGSRMGLGVERRGQSDLRNRVAEPLVAPSRGLPAVPRLGAFIGLAHRFVGVRAGLPWLSHRALREPRPTIVPGVDGVGGVQNWSVIWVCARSTSCNVTMPIGGPSWSATKTRRFAESVTILLTASFTGVFGEVV